MDEHDILIEEKEFGMLQAGVRIGARFDSIFFPMDFVDFCKVVTDLEFSIIGQIPRQPVSTPPGAVTGASGPVAQKDDCVVDINMQKQFFGIEGMVKKNVKDGFFNIYNNMLKYSAVKKEKMKFFELHSKYSIFSNIDPHKIFFKDDEKITLVKEINKIFKNDMSLFSTRISSAGWELNNPNYFELWIQPSLLNPKEEIGINVIYRNEDLSLFKKMFDNIDKEIIKLVNKLRKNK